MNDLRHFKIPEQKPPEHIPENPPPSKGFLSKFHHRVLSFIQARFGRHSKLTRFWESLMPETTVDQTADHLLALKRSRSAHQRLQSTLTLLLVFALIFTWKSTLPLLKNVDQLRNDLKEKQQLIQMEEKNLEALKKLADDDEVLDEHLNMLYAALPPADEKAEDMISMLENIAAQNRMVIDGIGIRKLSESQINYDDLLGVVDIYEYSFTLESAFENISSFLRDLRSSLRLMDVMAMEVEENKGLYRANFILHAYHLTPY